MASYSEWNKALCNFLFNEDKLGKPVYLHVPEEAFDDDATLKALGGYSVFKSDMLHELGGCPDELIICAERKWAMDKRHLSAGNSLSVIPGHLALMLILAAATETDADGIESNAYYQRIPLFFGIKSPKSFVLKKEPNSITNLYNRIQNWSEKTCEGKLGIFRTQVLGHHAYVGIIQAQTIFKPSDIEELWLQFRKAGYRPGDQYSEVDLENILRSGKFSPRIEKALSNEQLRKVAILRVQDELEAWDGNLSKSSEVYADSSNYSTGQVVLQIFKENALTNRLAIGIRLRDPRDYFDDYTVIIPKKDKTELKQTVSPDSVDIGLTKVILKPSNAIKEGIKSFTQDFDIRSEDGNFIFKYHSKKIRIFVQPITIGILRMTGWIEVPAIIKGVKHILMIDREYENEFLKYNELRIKRDLTADDKFIDDYTNFSTFIFAEEVLDTLVDSRNQPLVSLAIADRPKIRPLLGLKADIRGNTYLRESPPQVVQFFGLDNDCMILQEPDNFYLLDTKNNDAHFIREYSYNSKLVFPNSINFSVVKHGITLARCKLDFVDNYSQHLPKYFVSSIGEILDAAPVIDRYKPQEINRLVSQRCPDIKLVGREPGELADLSDFKNNFKPCWVVEVRKSQKTFHYCGFENLTFQHIASYQPKAVENVNLNNKQNISSWVRFISDEVIRCGITARPYKSSSNFTEVCTYVKKYLDQQIDWISKNLARFK